MLSFVKAWETSLAILPGLLMALPYGMVADKYGPKRVLLLVFLGNIISLGLETVVCEFYSCSQTAQATQFVLVACAVPPSLPFKRLT